MADKIILNWRLAIKLAALTCLGVLIAFVGSSFLDWIASLIPEYANPIKEIGGFFIVLAIGYAAIIPTARLTGSLTPNSDNEAPISKKPIVRTVILIILLLLMVGQVCYGLSVGKIISISNFPETISYSSNRDKFIVILASYIIPIIFIVIHLYNEFVIKKIKSQTRKPE